VIVELKETLDLFTHDL